MLPPILEIYVVWHPNDVEGAQIAEEFVGHFHGTVYTGLIGGAVEVFTRSQGWHSPEDAPRPIPSSMAPLPNGISPAKFMAIVPLIGTEIAFAAQNTEGAWAEYLENIKNVQEENYDRVGVFPYLLDGVDINQTVLEQLLGSYQRIATSPLETDGETDRTLRCRDLAQGICQLLSKDISQPLTVFISHTKHATSREEENVAELIKTVRHIISDTPLRGFFAPHDLQPGSDWDDQLRNKAATSAMLALRTDFYSNREWCQREMAIAKREGMPVVIMDALCYGEERGSFLMDHVPRIPCRMKKENWHKPDIYRALNLLVNECLKRALWIQQKELSHGEPELEVTWWAPHAPEPVTFAQWLENEKKNGNLPDSNSTIRILHPAPPLGPEEENVLRQVLSLSCTGCVLDIMTPRLLAARERK